MMTYWVLPRSGIPISTNTVQQITNAQMQTDVVKEQMSNWTSETKRTLNAKSADITWDDKIPQQVLFYLEEEDKEFKRNFSMMIKAESEVDDTLQGTEDGDIEGTTRTTDNINAQNYVNMEIGLRRGQEGELQRATVRRRMLDKEGNPIGIANSNQVLDTRQYEVEYKDGGTEVLSANILAENILAQVDEHGHRHRMMEEIVDHRKGKGAIKKSDGYHTLC